MFRFSLRKMFKNRWLTLSLLVGYLMAVAIVTSMPIYSNAILDRMLQKDLQQIQVSSNVYPGWISAKAGLNSGGSGPEVRTRHLRRYDAAYHDNLLADIGLPVQEDILYTAINSLRVSRSNYDVENIGTTVPGSLASCTGLFDNVKMVAGELPSAEVKDGFVEVIISEAASKKLKCSYGSTYTLWQYVIRDSRPLYYVLTNVKIVGIYEPLDNSALFWGMRLNTFDKSLMMDPGLFEELYVNVEEPMVNYAQWGTALDYTVLLSEEAVNVAETIHYYDTAKDFGPTLDVECVKVLEKYSARQEELIATLWVIEVPILLMLLLYIFMVSRLILDHEKNEIAVLRSRGAKKSQITLIYLVQAACLAAVALVVGPLISLVFCKMIGASNGFMEFVSRASLKVKLGPDAALYACVTAGVLVLTMLIAVICGKENSIVNFKRKKTGRWDAALWEKLFLDVICLAVSLYGLYNFRNRAEVIQQTGVAASDVPIDFLLYGSSTLFILGSSLLFLRIFPLLIKLIYRIGQRLWGPVLYMSLLNTSRSARKNQMISLFLIFTLSMGVFNAVTVRTLNRNEEDRINYSIGADVALQESWMYHGTAEEPYYTEPRFSRFEELETVDKAARVLNLRRNSVIGDSMTIPNVTIMGIVPDEFGELCWFRNGLNPHHLNEYLNLLAMDQRAVLMSNEAMESHNLEPGDTVYLNIEGNRRLVPCIIYAGIDYFPTYNPKDGNYVANLVVANLTYLQQETVLRPYQVWLQKAEGVSSAELYAELLEKEFKISQFRDASAEIIEQKNDALTQGVNGFFTLSFIVTMLITFVGFFIYWILAIKGRTLQFGLLRSMGLSRVAVMLVLLWEQLLVLVTAIIAGLSLGTLTAQLFAPILESNVDPAEQIMPFLVTASTTDYWRIIVIVSMMMIVAAVVLGRIVFRLRAGEALKLGED
ncbi:MAG: ABC transporter permease [Oscillospiraceae bacterium]|nr:ABC transporter permease [Oscillospiraceae bacterium]